jgi:DNA-binding response OmpR family regulator
MRVARILVVDDDFRICRNLSDILEKDGHDVKIATQAQEALKLVDKRNFDIAIIDLVMPGMDGMELLSELKRKKPNLLVIMITAFATVENAVNAMRSGAADYIQKPFKTNEIQVTVRRVLEEANFKKRIAAIEKTPSVEKIISSLDSSTRRYIILFLEDKRCNFTEIMKGIGMEDPTKFNFHLKKLKSDGLVTQDEGRKYLLTESGRRALDILLQLKDL